MNRSLASRTARIFGALALLWVSWASAAGYQASSAEPAAQPAGAQPLPVESILSQADEDQQQIEQARRLLASPDPVAELTPDLDSISRSVDGQARLMPSAQLRGVPVMRLESLSRQWAFNQRRLDHWQATAQVRLAPYASQAVRLAKRRATWAATRAQGILDGLPPALTQRVDTILRQIDETEPALGAALAAQDALKSRANALGGRIRSGLAVVDSAISRIDRRLLELDAPPLWKGLTFVRATGASPASEESGEGLVIETQFATDYRAAGGANQQALKLFHLLLIPFLIWLTVRARRQAREPSGRQVPRALRRPVSSFLLLSMLAVLAFEPDAPLLVEEIVLLIALVPAARLVPGGLRRKLGMWPYVAVVLYVIDQSGVVVVGDAGLYRLFILAQSCLGLGLSVWLMRRNRLMPGDGSTGLARLVQPVAAAVTVLFVVSVASNIVGNVSLAETLTSGVIDSGYMALVLYAAAAAILGICGALTHDPALARAHVLVRYGHWLRSAGAQLLWLVALVGWLLYSLSRFRLLRPLQEAGLAAWDWGLNIGEASVHVGDVVTFIVAIVVAVQVARGLRILLREELPRRAALPRGLGNSVASLSYYVVLILGLLFGLSAAGLKLGQMAFLFGAFGVGIGFGLQNLVNNFVSGVVLMIERPIQPGDVVDVSGSSGTVRIVGLRATVIRTAEGSDVIVPNGALLSGNLTNWTMFDRARRIEVVVGVAYGADPNSVIALLEGAATLTPGVAEEPRPTALLATCGDSALQFVVRAWTRDLGDSGQVRSDLLARILASLDAAGVVIPFSQMDINLRHVAADAKAP